jgi:hypothetical protein
MRSIDIHAHLFPQCFWNTVNSGKDWYGVTLQTGDGPEATVSDGKRDPLTTPKHKFTPEERLKDMD